MLSHESSRGAGLLTLIDHPHLDLLHQTQIEALLVALDAHRAHESLHPGLLGGVPFQISRSVVEWHFFTAGLKPFGPAIVGKVLIGERLDRFASAGVVCHDDSMIEQGKKIRHQLPFAIRLL